MARIITAVLALAASGCGGEIEGIAVGGAVTYDGQPVESGEIGFIPDDASAGQGASAVVTGGRYSIPHSAGLLGGDYRVVIYAERSTGRQIAADESGDEKIDQVVQYLPPVYNDQTRLATTIDVDRDDLDFVLERPSRRRR